MIVKLRDFLARFYGYRVFAYEVACMYLFLSMFLQDMVAAVVDNWTSARETVAELKRRDKASQNPRTHEERQKEADEIWK